jgi:cobalt/nickel transport system permease protein
LARLASLYRHRDGFVQRAPPALKLALTLAFSVALVLAPRGAWTLYAVAAALLLAVALAARAPARALLARLALLEPFALGVAVLALFQPDGVAVFAALAVRSTLCLAALLLLQATTRFTDLLDVLRRWRVPALLVTTLALLHRYLFVLAEESARLARARRARAFVAGRARAWQGAAGVAAELAVRASERAERVWAAMCARGWKT